MNGRAFEGGVDIGTDLDTQFLERGVCYQGGQGNNLLQPPIGFY